MTPTPFFVKDITKTDYAALGINDIRDYKWYVPTGTQTLTVKPDDGAVLMLGDDGSNQFEGANGNDVLEGRLGDNRMQKATNDRNWKVAA